MINARSVISWTLASCNNIANKNKSMHLRKAGFVIHLGSALNMPLTWQCLPHRLITSLINCSNPSMQGQAVLLSEERSAKYKVGHHGDSKKSILVGLKHRQQDEELLEMFGLAVRRKKNQQIDCIVNKDEMKKESTQFLENTSFVNSLSQETSDICCGHYFVSAFPYGFKQHSMDMKHQPNNLLSNLKLRPGVLRQFRLLHALSRSSSLHSFILDKYSFRYLARPFSSSLNVQSVIEKSDLTMNKALDNDNSIMSGGLQMSDAKCEFNEEQKVEIRDSESQQFPRESVYISKDLKECTKNVMSCENPNVSNIYDFEFIDVQNGSEYNDLYFNLMNGGNQAVTNSISDLSSQETTQTCDNYIEKYSKLMNAGKTDEGAETVSKGKLTHTDNEGKAVMVDVGDKMTTCREARAEGRIYLGPEAAKLVKENKMKKGDVLTVAQIAGIIAAKQTAQLIPLCHNINLTKADVVCVLNENTHSIDITSYVRTIGVTGVEMEALTAASIAALTVYDMCKAVTHDMVISDIRLTSKSGGKRDFHR